jgi:hypothetical protein
VACLVACNARMVRCGSATQRKPYNDNVVVLHWSSWWWLVSHRSLASSPFFTQAPCFLWRRVRQWREVNVSETRIHTSLLFSLRSRVSGVTRLYMRRGGQELTRNRWL